ncbi:hypothetical protein GOV09_05480 [Candidatus Woesearchaeota archaeon]|nr:hypothetical protein [Candidatus Woesearchaeota archaeon]
MVDEKIKLRRPNLFENMLLVMSILATGIGYFFVHQMVLQYSLISFESTMAVLLWLLLIIFIINVSVNENSKEELKILIKQQHEEMRILRHDLRRKR